MTPGKHARLPCLPSPGTFSNLGPLSWWCHPTISSSVITFSSCLQSFPASGYFQMSWLFTTGGQSIGASDSASVLPINIQHWFPLGLTALISLQSKELSRIFSNTTVQEHQFFSTQPYLWSISSFPGGLDSNMSAYKVEDLGSIPGSGRSGEVNGNPLQYSCLENPMDRGAW